MTRIVYLYTAGLELPPEKKSGTDLAVTDLFHEIGKRWEILPVPVAQIQTSFLGRQWESLRDGAPSVIVDRLAGAPTPESVLRKGDRIVLADDYAGLLLGKGWNPAVFIRHNALHHSYAKVVRTTLKSRFQLGYTTWLARRFDTWTTRAAKAVVAPAGTTELVLKKLVPEGCVLPWRPRIPRLENGPLTPSPSGKLRGLFFANFKYAPNFESLKFICHTLGPALAGTSTSIKVCGPWINEKAAELNVPPNVEICGFQEDLQAFASECDFGIVPIFHGEGILLKTLTLMGFGMPIVASTMASAGTGLVNGENAFIADDVGSMVQAIERLQNPDLRRTFGHSAWNAAESFSSSSGIVPAIQKAFELDD